MKCLVSRGDLHPIFQDCNITSQGKGWFMGWVLWTSLKKISAAKARAKLLG
jgi:hypothetical protein